MHILAYLYIFVHIFVHANPTALLTVQPASAVFRWKQLGQRGCQTFFRGLEHKAASAWSAETGSGFDILTTLKFPKIDFNPICTKKIPLANSRLATRQK